MPAQAGIQFSLLQGCEANWVPAYAGTTMLILSVNF